MIVTLSIWDILLICIVETLVLAILLWVLINGVMKLWERRQNKRSKEFWEKKEKEDENDGK